MDEQDRALLEPRAGCSWDQGVWTTSHSLPASLPPLPAQEGAHQWSSGADALGTAPTSPRHSPLSWLLMESNRKCLLFSNSQPMASFQPTGGDSGAPLILQPFLHRFPEVPV